MGSKSAAATSGLRLWYPDEVTCSISGVAPSTVRRRREFLVCTLQTHSELGMLVFGGCQFASSSFAASPSIPRPPRHCQAGMAIAMHRTGFVCLHLAVNQKNCAVTGLRGRSATLVCDRISCLCDFAPLRQVLLKSIPAPSIRAKVSKDKPSQRCVTGGLGVSGGRDETWF